MFVIVISYHRNFSVCNLALNCQKPESTSSIHNDSVLVFLQKTRGKTSSNPEKMRKKIIPGQGQPSASRSETKMDKLDQSVF